MNVAQQWMINTSFMVSSATVSFISSSTIVAMIVLSKNPSVAVPGSFTTTLKTSTYHRIILGLSVSDMFQSAGYGLGPFLSTSDLPQNLWAVGNRTSCQFDGVMTAVGFLGTQLYTFLLSYYTLCTVKKASKDIFSLKIEIFLHTFIILTCALYCSAALVTTSFNTYVKGGFCTVAAFPTGCMVLPEIYGECDRQILNSVEILAPFGFLIVPLICLVGIIACMLIICWHTITTTKILEIDANSNENEEESSRFKRPLRPFRKSTDPNIHDATKNSKSLGSSDAEADNFPVDDVEREGGDDSDRNNCTRRELQVLQPSVRIYRQDICIQAFLYFSGYLFTYGLAIATVVMNVILKVHIPFWFHVMASLAFPLTGLFNMLIYTRPKVVTLRRKHPELSRFRAFRMVLRAGVAVPMGSVEGPSHLSFAPNSEYALSSRRTPSIDPLNRLSSDGLLTNGSEEDNAMKVRYYYDTLPSPANPGKAASESSGNPKEIPVFAAPLLLSSIGTIDEGRESDHSV